MHTLDLSCNRTYRVSDSKCECGVIFFCGGIGGLGGV